MLLLAQLGVCVFLAAPFVLITAILRNKARARRIALFAAACFVAGGLVGWSLRPLDWQMSLWETAYAGGNAAKYGHAVEHQAENLFVACVVFPSLIGAIVSAAVAGLVSRLYSRRSPA